MAYSTIDEYGNDVVVLSNEYPVARKDYLCSICEELIKKGEKHTKQAIVFDGSVSDVRSHTCCLHGVCEHLTGD